MPPLGQDIPTAHLVEWLKAERDPVEQGEVIVIVETEKACFEVEAEASGVLLEIIHQAGEEVPILTPIGYIGQPSERPAP